MDIKEMSKEEQHDFKFFCKPATFTKLISNKKKIFCVWAFIGYLGQFLLCVSCLNLYSDNDRHLKCGEALTNSSIDPTTFYDTALFLLSIYHIIEFVRFTLFMTCAFLEVNLIQCWYILGLNTIYGFAIYLYAHKARFDTNGKECADI
jgi:hypothetical protein